MSLGANIKWSIRCKRLLSKSYFLLKDLGCVLSCRIFAIRIGVSEFLLKREKWRDKRPDFGRSEVVGSNFDFRNKRLI